MEGWWRFLLPILPIMGGFAVFQIARTLADLIRVVNGLKSVPKAPGQRLITGNAVELILGCPWEIMHRWVMQRWPIVHCRMLHKNFVLVGSAEGMKEVFLTGERKFVKDLDMSFKPFLGILGTGMVTAHGKSWQNQRVKVGPILRNDMLEHLVEITTNATNRLSRQLEEAKASGRAVEIEEEFRKLTLQIIGEAFLSLGPEECDRVFPRLYLPLMVESNTRTLQPWRMYLPTRPWFQHRRLLAELNGYVIAIIKQRWKQHQSGFQPARPDLLDRRIAGILEREEQWSAAMELQLCSEFKTFLLAGHETSAAMLTWSLFELTQHPTALQRVQEEAAAASGSDGITRAGAEAMTYTLCVLKETLRKYSVVPVVTRQASVDTIICGHNVPRGTYVALFLSAVHDMWQEAMAWRPERFMPGGESDSLDDSIRQYHFVAFGGGPRVCLGQNFALLEARVVLALLLQRFSFEVAQVPKRTQQVIPVGTADGMRLLIH